ncbi:MAG TPA: DsbC family protein [Gammaproteobacteria bacterium]|nr:DsbC family protein [Gammaproteobacteria bacterium]
MPRSNNLAIALVLCVAAPALPAADDAELAAVRARIAEKYPQVSADQIHPSPIDGLFEIAVDGQIAYMTADGRHLFQGELIDLDGNVNLTEQRRSEARAVALAGIDEKDMIIFAPAKAKHTVTIFTDVDCAYCRKLHREMSELNAHGLRVRYVFYPRTGPGTPSWQTAEKVWCADDRNAAITAAKADQPFQSEPCKQTPIQQHWELGHTVGLRGTPAIVTESGDLIPGYVPAAALAEKVQALKSKSAAVARTD